MNGIGLIGIFLSFLIVFLVLYKYIAWCGWQKLVEHFCDRPEEPLFWLRFQTAGLGKGSGWNPWGGVRYARCLHFDFCRSGLRVAYWGLFGPFFKPFFVPWGQISVEEERMLVFRMYRLSFGSDDLVAMMVDRQTYKNFEASGFLKSSTFG